MMKNCQSQKTVWQKISMKKTISSCLKLILYASDTKTSAAIFAGKTTANPIGILVQVAIPSGVQFVRRCPEDSIVTHIIVFSILIGITCRKPVKAIRPIKV